MRARSRRLVRRDDVSLTFTYDLEDPRPSASFEQRHSAITRDVLDFLEERSVRGTFFVVGDLAKEEPDLIAEIAGAGHEIAFHGWTHTPLTKLTPPAFAEGLKRGVALLEDASQRPVKGFRAPIFSLVPATRWAVEMLVEHGFEYSSSVLPAANPLNGFPAASRGCFQWSEGLWEFPCPVAGVGAMSIPFLGGVYLRYLPLRATLHLGRGLRPDVVPWIYCHPYDFDTEQPFYRMPQAGWITSRITYHRRGDTYRRVGALLGGLNPAQPLGERMPTAIPMSTDT